MMAAHRGGIKEARGRRFGNLPSLLSLSCLSHPPSVCFPPSLSPLLPPSAFHHDSLSVRGTGGKSSGFTMFSSNEKRHGDSAVLAQRPHLLSLLLLCISVCISHSLCSSLSLYMLPTVSVQVQDHVYHLFCINANQRRLFLTVDF